MRVRSVICTPASSASLFNSKAWTFHTLVLGMLGQRKRLRTRQKEQPDQHQHPQAEKARNLRGVHATAMLHHRRRRPRPDPPQNRQQAEAPTRRSSWTGCRTWRPYAQSLGDWLRNVKRLQPRLLRKWRPRSRVFAALRSLLKLARARALCCSPGNTVSGKIGQGKGEPVGPTDDCGHGSLPRTRSRKRPIAVPAHLG